MDGRRATTNKPDFTVAAPYGLNVNSAAQARWMEDGKFFTSSGVSSGMDMDLAVMAKLLGQDAAGAIAGGMEYDWHSDPG